MNYRISFDVEAVNIREAFKGLGIDGIKYMPRVEVDPLTEQEKTIVLELARVSLRDEENFNFVSEELDLSKDCLKELQEKIERKMLTPA